jgi:hypothetical protein
MNAISTISDIRSSVALATLNISVFTGERVDRSVTDEIANTHGTVANESGRYVKQIISKTALKEINKVAGAARSWFYNATLPAFDHGQRMFNMKGYFALAEQAGLYDRLMREGVDDFIRRYPEHIQEARVRLNGMFNSDDYPDVAGMRALFRIDFRVMPMPDTDNWFLTGIGERMNDLRSEAEANVRSTLKEGMVHAYQRIIDRTRQMADKLSAYGVDPETGKATGIFRDSLVDNVRELISILPTLNITNDPALDDIARQLGDLVRHDASALRADPGFRRDVADRARQIAEAASTFL